MELIDNLLVFIHLAETKSFTKTASLMKISQATVSRQIKDLESKFNLSLILRDSRVFKLTDSGQILYDNIKNDLIELEDKIQNLTYKVNEQMESPNNLKCNLKIVIPPLLGYNMISEHLPAFISLYPEIDLTILYEHKIDILDDAIDYAITSYIPQNAHYLIKHIATIDYQLYCTKEYAETFGIPKSVHELKNHAIIGFHNISQPDSDGAINSKEVMVFNSLTEEEFYIEMPKKLKTSTPLQNTKMIASSKFICPLHRITACELSTQTELVKILPEFYFAKSKFYSLRHPLNNSPAIRLFSNFIEDLITRINN